MEKLSFHTKLGDRVEDRGRENAGSYSDEECYRSFLRGEERGFDQLFHRHYAPLCYFALGFLGNQQAAEDIVGDSFLKLWERREKMATQGSLRSYLYTTVQHACIDACRRERRKELYRVEVKATGDRADQPVLHRIIEAETLHKVYACLRTLPPKCGQVFRMYYLEERSLQEIATELQLSLSTVKSQKGRALGLLKERVRNQDIL